jgi:hypothetical protein
MSPSGLLSRGGGRRVCEFQVMLFGQSGTSKGAKSPLYYLPTALAVGHDREF